ncbi:SAM-dependent methyltransferase, partial [Pseudomonas syringae pv. tagetis]
MHAHPLQPVKAPMSFYVPGRKRQQIEAIASHLDKRDPATHWLDLTAAKAHLVRRLIQPAQR